MVQGVPPRRVLPLRLSGFPPRSLAARHGRTLLGGGSPSPSPPLSAACVRCTQPFGGALSSVSPSSGSLSLRVLLGFSFPPLLPLCFIASCGPMAIFGQRRLRSDWSIL